MEEEKILRKLTNKAERIENVDLKEEEVMDMENLGDFYNVKGKCYFHEEGQVFIKKTKEGFYRYKNKVKEQQTQEVKEEEVTKQEMVDAINELYENNKKMSQEIALLKQWNTKFKEYIDYNLAKIAADQEEFFKLAKESIDLKTKEKEEKCQKKQTTGKLKR